MSKVEDQLLAEIEAYLVEHDMSPTQFGLLSINDGHLVHQLRAKKLDIRASKINRIRAYMRGECSRPQRRVGNGGAVAAA